MTDMARSDNDKKESPLVDSTGRSLIDYLKTEFGHNTIGIEGGIGAPVMRFRPPFQNIARYDTRADGLQLVIDNITQRRLPINVAYIVALNYIEKYASEFDIEDVPYSEDEIEANIREGANWAKKILDGISEYCLQIISGTAEVKGLPKNWWKVPVSSATHKGSRKQQEDRMVVLPSLQFHLPRTTDSVSLFGVLDGHGGASIASYAAAHLPYEIGAALEKHPDDRAEALRSAMDSIDRRVTSRCQIEPWSAQGSTAVVSLLDENSIHIRWLGDSNAYLMTSSEVRLITNPHTPKDEEEAARVQQAGGELMYIQGELRVNGVLNLTRALGDLSGRPVISGESDGLVIERNSDQYLLMFMCDGVCEVHKQSDIFELVRTFVNENGPEEYHELAESLVKSAIHKGSSDNCTCVIAFLRPPIDLWNLLRKSEYSDDDSENIDL